MFGKPENNIGNKTKTAPNTASAAAVMQDMMQTMDALRAVYVKETEALTRADIKGFSALQGEKMETARLYQGALEQIMARKDELKAADPTLKSRLENKYRDFAAISEKNLNALQRMTRCIDHIGNTMRDAAKQEASKQRTFSYGRAGTLRQPVGKGISMGLSETA